MRAAYTSSVDETGTAHPDEFEVLCERCGYVVEGLQASGNCPECGLVVEESLPEARPGSPWQQGPSVRSWLLTVWRVCLQPRRTLRLIAYRGSAQSAGLYFCNALIPPGVGVLGFGIWIVIMELATDVPEDSFSSGFVCLMMLVAAIAALCAWLAVTALTLGFAAIIVRFSGATAPISRYGVGSLVLHASCVLAPVGAILVPMSFLLWSDSDAATLLWLAVLGAGFSWFGAVCVCGVIPESASAASAA